MKTFHVYVLASRTRVLYFGVTSHLEQRLAQHRAHAVPGFTARYNVDRLVYTEETSDALAAIGREKQIKGWTRAKKVALIEVSNPEWLDLMEAAAAPRSFAALRMTGVGADTDLLPTAVGGDTHHAS